MSFFSQGANFCEITMLPSRDFKITRHKHDMIVPAENIAYINAEVV